MENFCNFVVIVWFFCLVEIADMNVFVYFFPSDGVAKSANFEGLPLAFCSILQRWKCFQWTTKCLPFVCRNPYSARIKPKFFNFPAVAFVILT